MVGRARGDGDAHSFDPYEQDRFHCPEKGNQEREEREESRWTQSVRDNIALLVPHPPSSGTRTAKRTWELFEG